MKNFSKTLISMAAVMAVGSAMAVSALATDNLSIDTKDLTSKGTITITSGVTTGKSQYTLLVVQGTLNEETKVYSYDANSSTIKQVDQNDLGTPFSTIALGTKQEDGTYKLDEGSYKVLVGNNNGSLDSGIFTVSSTPGDEEIIIGDVDGNRLLNTNDATYIARRVKNRKADKNSTSSKYTANVGDTRDIAKSDDTITIGDVDGNKLLNTNDATYIARRVKNRKADKNSTSSKYTANVGDSVYVDKIN